ncbi:MAG: hypothetical protein OEV40_18105 [Acidimicrobiia bacterium]|nr:hypothetical protein [Acidimicrobiia bacterium]
MTKQESFKRTVRARMAKTGEKFGAARRALLNASDTGEAEPEPMAEWVEQPEVTDGAVREATGRGWDEWCRMIDEWPERAEGHAAMAARLGRDHLASGWWAQTVIVGYERIRGLRTKYLRADGSFAGSVTRTVEADADRLRTDLLDPAGREAIAARAADELGRPIGVELRSKPSSKTIRLAIHPDGGTALLSITEQPDGRVRVAVQHESLPSTVAVETWKAFWARWLDTVT